MYFVPILIETFCCPVGTLEIPALRGEFSKVKLLKFIRFGRKVVNKCALLGEFF